MSQNTKPRVAVIATCFNRRDTTLAGLASFAAATSDLDIQVYLTDDGCPQKTGDAVRAAFPDVTILEGDGSLYWNQGMRKAWLAAIPSKPDYYLWWNDDLIFYPGALDELFAFQKAKEAEHGPRIITVGKVVDPDTGEMTYGARVKAPGWSKLRFILASDDGRPCDTMNGNCVLIPARAVDEVGVHYEHYSHAQGDTDYGLRAVRAGYKIFQSPNVVGTTPYNTAFEDGQAVLTLKTAKFVFTHPKGLPWRERLHFCREFGGWLWPVNFVWRYAKMIRLSN